jgi:hypothetical protein
MSARAELRVAHCRAILASLTQVVPHCRTAARQLFGKEVPPGPLQMKTLRNADFREVSLEGNVIIVNVH